MMDNHTYELINGGLDGELDSVESEQLDVLLESSADARAERDELLKLSNILDGQAELNPPSNLTQDILQQIKLPSGRGAFSLGKLFSSFQPAVAGAAFAAGVLLSVGLYEMAPRNTSEVDLAHMVGTMVAGKTDSAAIKVDAFTIDQSGLSGSVSLRESENVLMLDFNLESSQQVQIELALAEAGLAFAGIAQVASQPENVNESYAVSGGTLSVLNQGRQAFTVFLRNVASEEGNEEISIEFSSGGERVFLGMLRG